jgi:hypothetical protein
MLKYKDLYDYIISVLYSLKRKNQIGFFSLREIIINLDYPATPNEIFEIGKYLEAEGYVKADFRLGDVFVEITPQGIIYIENKEENFFPTFEEFLNQKSEKNQIEKIVSKLSSKSIHESKKPIIEKINLIIKYLGSVNALKNSDLHIDAKILKLELEKEKPDKEIITIKIMNLETLKGLRQQANELKEYFIYFMNNRHF